MGGKPGFGNTPSYKTIKVSIVGNASPRWRGVSAAEADKRNWTLSMQRADAVKAVVAAELRSRLGAGVDIQFDVSNGNDASPHQMQIGAYGVGSSQTLREAGGNRNDNTDYSRRVEVNVELITSTGHSVGRSLSPQRYPAQTKFWYASIKEIHVAAAAVVVGEVTLILRNSLSGKKMLAKAQLWGGGINTSLVSKHGQWKTAASDVAQTLLTKYPEASFSMNREIGFGDFDGKLIRLEKVEGKLIYGAAVIYMTIVGSGKGAETIMLLRKRGWGLPKLEGWVASGALHLLGDEPGDYWEEDGGEESEMVFTDKSQREVLVLNFDTGSARLTSAAQSSVSSYIATWSRRMFGP